MPCSCDRMGMWDRRENVIVSLVVKWLESEDFSDIDIDTLTLEQYLVLNRNNSQMGVKRPEIEKNATFEIKSQLLKELRENAFSGGKTEDAMEHLRKILEIASLFNTPGILGNDIMLRIFPLTLTGAAKRWLGRTSSELLKTQDELKQIFIQKFCPPSVTFKQMREIHNFWQEVGETLTQTWERFNELLFKCPFHDLNDYQKVNTFYKGLNFYTRQILDSRGLITRLTASEALESIQEKVYHFHRSNKEESSNNSFSTITEKLKILNHDMSDLREEIHKINQKPNMEFHHEEVKKYEDNNALAYLGASISVMPFSLFKHLGLGNPRPVNMVIEMADRSMQSPKGIVENALVNIHKFIFPVDFVVLNIIEDNKVPIILGRPMLATAHARIDVFGGKFLLKVRKEQVIFNAKEGATPITVSPVCIIKSFDVIDEVDGPDALEKFQMNDNLNGDLGNFLQDNNLFLNYETNSPFPDKSSKEIWSPTKGFQDSDNDFGGRIDELVAIDDLLGDQDPEALNNMHPLKPEFHIIGNRVNRYNHYNLQITCKIGFVNFNPYIDPISPFNIMSRVAYNSIMKRELTYTRNNILGKAKNLQVVIRCHSFLTNFIILENMNEFVEKGHNRGNTRDEDKAKGISHPYQKIKEFYKGCLNLGEEYKQDLEVFSTKEWNLNLLDSCLCGRKVLYRGETRLFYRHFARSQLLQLSLREESNTQGSLLL
ncbi:DNA damage-inducible protein 1-like protein [Tanacetum coccineum]